LIGGQRYCGPHASVTKHNADPAAIAGIVWNTPTEFVDLRPMASAPIDCRSQLLRLFTANISDANPTLAHDCHRIRIEIILRFALEDYRIARRAAPELTLPRRAIRVALTLASEVEYLLSHDAPASEQNGNLVKGRVHAVYRQSNLNALKSAEMHENLSEGVHASPAR